MVAPLIEPYASDALLLLSLCVWREARGESIESKRGVVSSIRNRCALAPREGFKLSARENILKPWSFSSFMEGDPNATKYPAPGDKAWQDCLTVAGDVAKDSVGGAVFYHDSSLGGPPKKKDGTCAWGAVEHTVTIGRLLFYRITAAVSRPAQ